jgi:hypothetical protein
MRMICALDTNPAGCASDTLVFVLLLFVSSDGWLTIKA